MTYIIFSRGPKRKFVEPKGSDTNRNPVKQQCRATCQYATNGVMKISEANLRKELGSNSFRHELNEFMNDKNRINDGISIFNF